MKATEYFDKYSEPIYAEIHIGKADSVSKMLWEMVAECQEALKKRKAHTDRATIAAIKEFNDKWNAINRLFEKKYGEKVIRDNGFYNYIRKQVPQLPPLVERISR